MKKITSCLLLALLLCTSALAEYTNDLEWLTQEGHPTFYGSTTQAHSIWTNIEKGKIIFADSFAKYQRGKTVLLMDGYSQEKNEVIRDLEVYFMNCNPPLQLTIDEAVPIAAEYFPHEIASKWYEHERSFYQPATKAGEYSYYVCYYGLTDAAGTAYYAKEHSYPGSMTIVFCVNSDGYVDYFHYTYGTPRGIGDPKTSDWAFDFMEYVLH